tara:strand:- start:178 stop:393 length:216 start_codon:yes stop_codon:yes gene_type:complete
MKTETSAGAAQLALALTRKLSTKTTKSIGKENINKNLFSKSKRKYFKKTTEEKNKKGPTIIICETRNFIGS